MENKITSIWNKIKSTRDTLSKIALTKELDELVTQYKNELITKFQSEKEMNLIQQSVQQITKENLNNYYDTEQAEEELFNMLQSNRLYMMKDRTLDFIKQISGKSGDSFNIRETGKFLSDLINELKIKYKIKE
jgi:hypothetical protein